MANVGILKKIVLVFFVLNVITIIFACYYIYKCNYLLSYNEINLEEITCSDETISTFDTPIWACITTQEQLDNLKEKYLLELPDIDFKEDMLIISYGAKLQGIKYNLKESTYKERGYYIGFPNFSNLKQNILYVYKTEFIPIFDTDTAGVAPNYKGKYRK